MTSRQIQKFEAGPSAHSRLVAQVEGLSGATHNWQDTVKEKDTAIITFNPNDSTNNQTLATLEARAKWFELKAQLGTLCAKGLRLAQQVLAASTPLPLDEELTEWKREMDFLVYTWFTQEQRAEWRSAGKEILDYVKTQEERLSKAPNDHEKVELANRLFALAISAEVDALERLSNDLSARINIKNPPRSFD